MTDFIPVSLDIFDKKSQPTTVAKTPSSGLQERAFYEKLVTPHVVYEDGPIGGLSKEAQCTVAVELSDRTLQCPCLTNQHFLGEPTCHEHIFVRCNTLLKDNGVTQTYSRIKTPKEVRHEVSEKLMATKEDVEMKDWFA